MKVFLDNRLIQRLLAEGTYEQSHQFIQTCLKAGILAEAQDLQITFNWPSLLASLDLGSLFISFPSFNDHNKLFAFITTALDLNSDKEILIRLYDQVFVECLTQVKALPAIQPQFLIEQIRKKLDLFSDSSSPNLFLPLLKHCEKSLEENLAHTMHDLILYLAWDRACIYLAIVCEHLSLNPTIGTGLEVLQECLIESFQHITAHGRTIPGFFRMMETLYAYQMREENLHIHSHAEWLVLSQGALALKPREDLSDFFYIDAAIVTKHEHKQISKEFLRVFTMDSVEKVQARLSLARYMIKKLTHEVSGWPYELQSMEVICMKEFDNRLSIDTILPVS